MRPKEIRTQNLGLLEEEFGSLAELSRLSGLSEKYLSQIKNKTMQRGTIRGMGDRAAEQLENGCGKQSGWMDQSHMPATPPAINSDVAKYEVGNGNGEFSDLARRIKRLKPTERATVLQVLKAAEEHDETLIKTLRNVISLSQQPRHPGE